MAKYLVSYIKTYYCSVEVNAETESEAIEKAKNTTSDVYEQLQDTDFYIVEDKIEDK